MKQTRIKLGPSFFMDGERSIYLKENAYLHIEQLDSALEIYDISFSDSTFTVCRLDNGANVEKRPWNDKRLIYLSQTGYRIYDSINIGLATIRNTEEEGVITVEVIEGS